MKTTNYLPILMYHAIRSAADAALPQTSSIEHAVEACDFRAQLDAIVRRSAPQQTRRGRRFDLDGQLDWITAKIPFRMGGPASIRS